MKFDEISRPQELLNFMNKNMIHGYVGKSNNRLYKYSDKDFKTHWGEEYYLQSPSQLLASNHGVCWDKVELERYWFEKNKYNYKTIFIHFEMEEENEYPSHTFLVFEKENKWYWFEHSFLKHRGIHKYEKLNELIEDVKQKQLEIAIEIGVATAEDYKLIKDYEYGTPQYGCDAEEFWKRIVIDPNWNTDNSTK